MKRSSFEFRFVEFIPKSLEDGVLYVSTEYATATHKCFCGCGMKVVTPLSPTDWRLIFDGDTVSLDPSVGNWSYPCRSHYVLRRNRVLWAGSMTQAQIGAIRAKDRRAKARYYGQAEEPGDRPAPSVSLPTQDGAAEPEVAVPAEHRLWRRLIKWLVGND